MTLHNLLCAVMLAAGASLPACGMDAMQSTCDEDDSALLQRHRHVKLAVADVADQGLSFNASITGSLWSQMKCQKRKKCRCIKCRRNRDCKKNVRTQMDCQKLAEAKGHKFYQYDAKKKKCGTVQTCTKTRRARTNWKIYTADVGEATTAAAKAAAAKAAKKQQMDQLTAAWPRTEWPQCGFAKHRCTSERHPMLPKGRMTCQNLAMKRGHAYYSYTPFRHFGLCGTSAGCSRKVPSPWKMSGTETDWRIYTWKECVEWTTRTTTTTTTVTQAQDAIDMIMGTKKAVGGCNHPGKRPDSATDAWVAGSALGYGLEKRIFNVPGVTFVPWKDSPWPPGQYQLNFGNPKQFFSVSRTDGREGVVWFDSHTKEVYMTWFAEGLTGAESTLLHTPAVDESLYAATSNGQDGIVLISAQSTENPGDKRSAGTLYALRFNSASGSLVKKVTVPTSGWSGFWKTHSAGGSAVWDNRMNTIAFFFSRLLPMHGDGLNHQLSHAVLLDGTSLGTLQATWTTSHSFANNIMQAEGNGGPLQYRGIEGEGDGSSEVFYGMELGDANPRGINVMRFQRHLSRYTWDNDGKWSYKVTRKTVYQMKTGPGSHGYNNVYTEIAHPGPVEVNDGLLVFFVGEEAPLDMTKAGGLPWGRRGSNIPRNIGFVKVSSDLRTIMSPGGTECAHGTRFGALCNTGINFITNFSSPEESASRLKTFKLSSDRILLTYDVWNSALQVSKYLRTEMMEVDKDGNVVRGKWDSCVSMRLPPEDNPVVLGGRGIAYAGSAEGLVRYEICAGAECN